MIFYTFRAYGGLVTLLFIEASRLDYNSLDIIVGLFYTVQGKVVMDWHLRVSVHFLSFLFILESFVNNPFTNRHILIRDP